MTSENKKTKSKLKIIVGLGKTGLSCVKYLLQQGQHNVAVVDSRKDPPCLSEFATDFAKIPHFFGGFDAPFFDRAEELIVSPGVSLRESVIAEQVAKGIPVIGDVELFVRAARVPIVAITGSNGKSTVTSLVGLMAEEAGIQVKVGGNLGVPVLELLDENAALYVLELSSFQLETTHSLVTSAATILNVTEDHMDRYTNLDEYCAAKRRIYSGCKIAILNRDDPAAHAGIKFSNSLKTISFGLSVPGNESEFGIIDAYLAHGEQKLLMIDELRIRGMHQVANALAALALGHAINLPLIAMTDALRKFPGLPHRCQWVRKINNIDWYNDSKGTNVGATKAAILGLGASISGKLILIIGGMGKDANFTVLRDSVVQHVRALILIGKDAKNIAKALDKTCKMLFASSLNEAVHVAQSEAQEGDAVLLSPACASFDMFKNFEHRGEVFMDLVQKLQSK